MSSRQTATTRLGQSVVPLAESHPTQSGVFPLISGRDALAARALLAESAEHSIDAQYYIWRRDLSGTLLLESLHRAADRGVHVRLLLDDNNTVNSDPLLAALNAHPNIELRLFNPFKIRRWRALNYLFDFHRLNRRMHNKSFTVDRQVTIIGGRNIGDEYFDAGQGALFADLDVMAIGPVVDDVSKDFARYWLSESALPAERVIGPGNPAHIDQLARESETVEHNPAASSYVAAIRESEFVDLLLSGELHFEWAPTRMISDDPAKGLGRRRLKRQVWPKLRRILGGPIRELELISPYFVPTVAGVRFFSALVKHGANVTVLTNSLEATDVPFVHAGYARRRKALLRNGVKLFELMRSSAAHSGRDRGLVGSSGSSLHAKTFSIDRARVFIGSFNFDPRSAELNTEMGFVIDSPPLAEAIAEAFIRDMPGRAYEVHLKNSELQWIKTSNGDQTVYHHDPGASRARRLALAFISLLPIEWLL